MGFCADDVEYHQRVYRLLDALFRRPFDPHSIWSTSGPSTATQSMTPSTPSLRRWRCSTVQSTRSSMDVLTCISNKV